MILVPLCYPFFSLIYLFNRFFFNNFYKIQIKLVVQNEVSTHTFLMHFNHDINYVHTDIIGHASVSCPMVDSLYFNFSHIYLYRRY